MSIRSHNIILLLLGGFFLLFLLSSCGTMSDRKVAMQLQERYDKSFTVISSQTIKPEDLAEGIYAAKVYLVAPEDDKDNRFFAYSTVKGETGGILGIRRNLADTYGLATLKALFEKNAQEAALELAFAYGREPFSEKEDYYYSSIVVKITANPRNLERACQVLSATIQEFIDVTGLTTENNVRASFVVYYREENWQSDDSCKGIFQWWDLKWDETARQYLLAPLDYSAENIKKMLLREIEDYKSSHEETTAASETKDNSPYGFSQQEDGTWIFAADKVNLVGNPATQHNDVQLWNEETRQWTVYVWNEEKQQYEQQIEP